MTTITWTPDPQPASQALAYHLTASSLPADMKVIIQFSYTAPGLQFDRVEFAGPAWTVVDAHYVNGRGTVKIAADLWPNSLDFATLWFTGSGWGSLNIDVGSIVINENVAGVIEPPPFDYTIGTPTLDDFKVNPLPDHLAPLVPEPVLDFITSIYVGAFQRAAEYGGLVYWTELLLSRLGNGMSAAESLLAITRDMHWVGTQNGEAGTGLGTADYVDFVYRNVLGREPDAGGKAYWVNYIEQSPQGRSEFLAQFLNSALQPGNPDGDYVRARVAVSKYYAQEDISGQAAIASGQTQALGNVLGSVLDESSAVRAIQDMINAKQATGLVPQRASVVDDQATDLVTWLAGLAPAEGPVDDPAMPPGDALAHEAALVASLDSAPGSASGDLWV